MSIVNVFSMFNHVIRSFKMYLLFVKESSEALKKSLSEKIHLEHYSLKQEVGTHNFAVNGHKWVVKIVCFLTKTKITINLYLRWYSVMFKDAE